MSGDGADILTASSSSRQPLRPLPRTTRKPTSTERARLSMTRSSRKHLAMIIHGARAEREDVRHLIDWVRGKGHLVEPRVTLEPGDGTAMAAAAARAGADAVIAIGGDGTVNEVLNGLDGFDTPLGIIPVGTANDFARQAGIPPDVDHAMDVILRTKPVRIDTGSV